MFKSRKNRESNWGPCGQKIEIVPTVPTMPAQQDTKPVAKLQEGFKEVQFKEVPKMLMVVMKNKN